MGGSVSVAVLLRKALSGFASGFTGSKLILINSLVASLAGGTASFLNTFFMRQAEARGGITVYADADLTQPIPFKSKKCAEQAIMETACSRVFLSISCLMSPALIFYLVEKIDKTPKGKLSKLLFETIVIIFALQVNLPASIAIFP